MRARLRRAAIGALLLAAGCGERATGPPPAAAPGEAALWFVDVAEQAGVRAVSWCGRPEKPHLLESGGCGLALFDYDADSDLDLYVVRAWRLDGARVAERTRNVLYRNRGDGTFEDVTQAAGDVGDDGFGTGVAVGDCDGDGRPDLFVTNFGPDSLFRNRGDGTFERVADGPGIDGWSAGSAFFDADQDGDLDLFVTGYVDCTLEEVLNAEPTLDWKGAKVMLGPFGMEGLANEYFRNDGACRFVRATAAAGLEDVGRYFSFGAAAVDLDQDLDLDLYVANDSNPNYLYRNEGSGRFTEVGLWSGAALSASAAAQAGMGIAVGDYDADLDADILVTNFAEDASTLYQNQGDLVFADVSFETGVAAPTFEPLSWGTVFSDFDLDGDEDLFIANGHIYPQADTAPSSNTTYAQRNLLLENAGGTFRDASAAAGPGLLVERSSRGVAAGDIDGDGDVDVVISNVDHAPTVLRNDSRRAGAWLLVDAPGALRVLVRAGGRSHLRVAVSGGSFCSAGDPRFHFGLGPASAIERVEVTWPDGQVTERTDVAVGRVLRLTRG